ncbi:MAG: shikimate kinase, partial [Eubacteriales bacterium]|nr:shikimate kinase [Eubacteriales bacterium]
SVLLGCPFLDLDEAIVRREGRDIPAIFADVGDAGFRLCETQALISVCGKAPMLIATGGGIVTREENIDIMRRYGLVIFINRPLEEMIANVRQDTRPNLAGDKEERMRTLFARREALYQKAAHVEFDNSCSAEEAVRRLASLPEIHALL